MFFVTLNPTNHPAAIIAPFDLPAEQEHERAHRTSSISSVRSTSSTSTLGAAKRFLVLSPGGAEWSILQYGDEEAVKSPVVSPVSP